MSRKLIRFISGFVFLAATMPICSHANDEVAGVAGRLTSGAYEGINGGMISVDGQLLFEAYEGGNNANKRHDIRSATKSITSLLIGKMIEEGSLSSVKVKVSRLLPDEFAHMAKDDPRRDIRVEDILTMRTGLACNDWVPASLGQEDKMYKTKDWAAFLLNQPLAYEIGEHFSYCTGGVVLLGRVIKKLTGMDVPAYADDKLFRPLGISDAKWERTPTGHTDTGGHLRLSLPDLHKIGLMVLNKGKAGDEQVISESWLKGSTKEHTQVYERRERYGYLWWLNSGEVKGQPVSLIYAHGNGGNFIFIVPELKLVAAFTGKNYGKPTQFIPMQILTREIIPALIE
ncbi:serine hydrolase domain-containing protein [Kordiimonas sp.]|uniref:serine hydrolase domain-containing protein n=1 Tax=Kordiimonas sp. TaxID=1970157 RepID=UPI003A8E66FB